MSCEAAECDRPVYARGHCSRHYRQLLRRGQIQPDRAPEECAAEGCERRAVTRGWCHGHYLRWSRQGDVKADVPLARPVRDVCSVDACERGSHSAGMCRSHYERLRKHGDPMAGKPFRTVTGDGSISHGYVWVSVPMEKRHLVPPGRKSDFEHRLVMAEILGRPLAPDEVVHHKDGNRLNNDPTNLELWNTGQPKGQRVADKLDWAYALLRRYDPEIGQALGWDLNPETGAPWDYPEEWLPREAS
jgi:hypothetical protein